MRHWQLHRIMAAMGLVLTPVGVHAQISHISLDSTGTVIFPTENAGRATSHVRRALRSKLLAVGVGHERVRCGKARQERHEPAYSRVGIQVAVPLQHLAHHRESRRRLHDS